MAYFYRDGGTKLHIESVRLMKQASRMGAILTLVVGGSIMVHFAVMLLDLFLVGKSLILNLEKDFLGTVFSFPMIPVLTAYILFFVIILYLWKKMKKALLLAHQREIESERERVALDTIQRFTTLIAEHITIHNAEILKWIEFRKQQGQQVSEKVEYSSKRIASALTALTELAYVVPYTQSPPVDTREIESLLQDRLSDDSVDKRKDTGRVIRRRSLLPAPALKD